MESANIVNSSCKEIVKIRRVYYEWHEYVTSVSKIRRSLQWRITEITLSVGAAFKLFNIDVTDWDIDENATPSEHGPICVKKLKGFIPKLNEFAESYFNEMTRRPMTIAYQDFEGNTYLFGGKNHKASFSFKKSISGRNGYDVEFINQSDESSLIIDDTDHFPAPENLANTVTLQVNGEDFTSIPCGNTFNLVVKDEEGDPVGTQDGLELEVPSGVAQSGVLLQWPSGQQYTSYRTGDEGDRMQSGYFNYTRPSVPEAIAELDHSLGANFWAKLKNNIAVNGVSSKDRFVDVDGGQTWSATGNKDKITICKLTGIGFYRIENDLGGLKTWNNAIDDALTFSVVVDGVTYSNWYLVSREEFLLLLNEITAAGSGNLEDPVSAAVIWDRVSGGASENWTSTTQTNGTSNAYSKGYNPSTYIRPSGKTTTYYPFLVFDARSLITAP